LFGSWIEILVDRHPGEVARSPNATTRHYSKAMRMPSDKAREKLLSGWKCSVIFFAIPEAGKAKETIFFLSAVFSHF